MSQGFTDAAVCWSFQTSLENTTLKNSGVGSKRLIKPSLSRSENGQSRAKKLSQNSSCHSDNNDRLWVVASATTTYSIHRKLENSFEIVSKADSLMFLA